jgi:phosphatidylinositol alpha-mannosyltransferase
VVLIEAMAAGTTVVASSLDGYRNVATDEFDALLVEPGDADSLADALRRVSTDTELAERLRRAGDARAEEFAMASLTERYLEIYRSICPSSG